MADKTCIDPVDLKDSVDVICRYVEQVNNASEKGDFSMVAIGTDFEGFSSPRFRGSTGHGACATYATLSRRNTGQTLRSASAVEMPCGSCDLGLEHAKQPACLVLTPL